MCPRFRGAYRRQGDAFFGKPITYQVRAFPTSGASTQQSDKSTASEGQSSASYVRAEMNASKSIRT